MQQRFDVLIGVNLVLWNDWATAKNEFKEYLADTIHHTRIEIELRASYLKRKDAYRK